MEAISKHISFAEATESATAIRLGIENIPNPKQLANIKLLAEKVFEPLRAFIGAPIRINSMFRNERLNKAIGGAKNSQHCALDGAALDLSVGNGHTNKELFYYILAHLDFDQLIWEGGNDENPQWVHVSYKEKGNRKQALRMKKVGGKSVYLAF